MCFILKTQLSGVLPLQKQVDLAHHSWPQGVADVSSAFGYSCYFLAHLGDGEQRLICGVSFQAIVRGRLFNTEFLR